VDADDRTAVALWNLRRARDDEECLLSPETIATLARLAAELEELRKTLGFQPESSEAVSA